MMNSELEVVGAASEGLWTLTRLAYLIAIAALAIAVARGRIRGRGVTLCAVLLFLGWFASNQGLSRIYGLIVPGDRARNLSWCMSAAAGNSPLGTGVVGQTSLEPFWASLVAALSLWSPERTLALYPYLSLAAILGVALSLYLHFRRSDVILGLVVAAYATLFATSALDFLGPFRGYWAKMFLLKPNHTVGFVLIPAVIGVLLQDSRRKAALGGGLLLGVLSLAFIVHWAFLCFALALYLTLTFLLRRADFTSELRTMGVAVAVSAVFVAPGLYVIARYFPHALTLAAGSFPELPMRSDWGDIIPVGVSLFFLATFEQGLSFYLALAGVYYWLSERSRASLLWVSVLFGAYLLWGLNYLLYLGSRAREADEFYFFLIFAQSIAAGYGAYRILGVLGARLIDSATSRQRAGALALLLAAPLGFPFWWDPMTMDSHYRAALDPIWPPIVDTTDWIRSETHGHAVFLASGDLMQWVPALSGRRSLPFSPGLRERLRRLMDTGENEGLGFDYIVWDEALESELGATQTELVQSGCCRLVHDSHAIRVYRAASGEAE
jgi:hypothetical protein